MKCKIENKGSALFLSCFKFSEVAPQELEYKYSVKLPDQELAALGPVWPGVSIDSYHPLLSCIQGEDQDDLLFKALYYVFSIASSGPPDIDSFKSALLRIVDKIESQTQKEQVQSSLKDLDAKLASSADGIIDGLNEVSKAAQQFSRMPFAVNAPSPTYEYTNEVVLRGVCSNCQCKSDFKTTITSSGDKISPDWWASK